jgi:hypothetical protein
MPRTLYICSAGHSGSTLLDLMLGSHTRIASLGEIDQLAKNISLDTACSCGARISRCELWREVLRRAGVRLDADLFSDPYVLHMGYPLASVVIDHAHQTRAYLLRRKLLLGIYYLRLRTGLGLLDGLLRDWERAITHTLMIFELVREVLDVELVVDSSKSYLKAIALYRRDPDNVRIVLLTRDGRGVLWSNLKRGVAAAAGVRAWRNQYQRALPLLERHVASAHIAQVRYEDLVAAPAQVLQRLCAWAGVEFQPRMLSFRATTHHIANGNAMRLDDSSELRLDTEWMTRLGVEELRYFDAHAGALNRRLGYS